MFDGRRRLRACDNGGRPVDRRQQRRGDTASIFLSPEVEKRLPFLVDQPQRIQAGSAEF